MFLRLYFIWKFKNTYLDQRLADLDNMSPIVSFASKTSFLLLTRRMSGRQSRERVT
jgi:hypothetical protein